MATVFDVLARFRADVTKYSGPVREATAETHKFEASIDNAGKRGIGAFGMLASRAGLLGTAIMGLTQTAGMMGIRTAAANEQAAIGFKVMLGSAEEAKKFMDELIEFSAKTPFELPQLRSAASALLSTGVEAKRIIPIMEALGDATAAKGYGAEAIGRAVYALQQMSTAGRATGQDMMQLTQAGVPVWESLAASLGKTIPEIKKLGEQGQISADQIMTAIESYAGAGMAKVKGMMVEQSGTLNGMISTLKDTINQALGNMMTPAVEAIKNALPQITTMMDNLLKSIGPTVNSVVSTTLTSLVSILPALEPMIIGFGQIFTAVMQAVAPLIPEIARALSGLTPIFASVSILVTELSAVLMPLVTTIFPVLQQIISAVGSVMLTLTQFVVANKDAFLVLVGVLAAAKVAFGIVKAIQLVTAALKAQTLATIAARIQTAIFNSVLYANPIGVLVAAIAGLVVAVVLMYKKFAWFRDAVRVVWNGIVEGFETAINFMLGIMERWVNFFIKGVNLIIKAWNLIPFHEDVKEIKELNFELDLTFMKLDKAADAAEKMARPIRGAGASAKQWSDALASRAKEATEATTTAAKASDGAGKGANKLKERMKALREQIKDTYENGLKAAKDNIDRIVKAQQDFMQSVSDSITSQATLTTAFDAFTTASKANEDAVQKQKDATAALAEEFSGAITKVVQFTEILSAQKAAQEAVAQATGHQAELTTEVADKQAIVNALMRAYNATRVRRDRLAILEDLKAATDDLAASQARLTEANKAVTAAQDEATMVGSGFLSGLEKQVEAARKFSEQLVALRDLNLDESTLKEIAGAGAVAGGQIAAELIAGGAAAVDRSNQLTRSLKTLSQNAGTNLASSFAQTGTTVATSLLDEMFKQVNDPETGAIAFANKIQTLVSMGLSKENLQMVLGAGSAAGIQIANQLITGGTDAINKANLLQAQLKTAATNAASVAGGTYYEAGKTLAQSLYDGLAAKWKELEPKLGDMKLPQLQQTLTEAQKTVAAVVSETSKIADNLTQPTPIVSTPPPAAITQPVSEYTAAAYMALGQQAQSFSAVAAAGKSRRDYINEFLEMVNRQFPGLNASTLERYYNARNVPGMASEASRRARWANWAAANNVPALANGGIVMPRPGGTLALLGEAGQREAVIPLPSGGSIGGGTTNVYNITIEGIGIDMQRAGRELVTILQEYERRNGRVPLKART